MKPSDLFCSHFTPDLHLHQLYVSAFSLTTCKGKNQKLDLYVAQEFMEQFRFSYAFTGKQQNQVGI